MALVAICARGRKCRKCLCRDPEAYWEVANIVVTKHASVPRDLLLLVFLESGI